MSSIDSASGAPGFPGVRGTGGLLYANATCSCHAVAPPANASGSTSFNTVRIIAPFGNVIFVRGFAVSQPAPCARPSGSPRIAPTPHATPAAPMTRIASRRVCVGFECFTEDLLPRRQLPTVFHTAAAFSAESLFPGEFCPSRKTHDSSPTGVRQTVVR